MSKREELQRLVDQALQGADHSSDAHVNQAVRSMGYRDYQGLPIEFDLTPCYLRDSCYNLIRTHVERMSADFQARVSYVLRTPSGAVVEYKAEYARWVPGHQEGSEDFYLNAPEDLLLADTDSPRHQELIRTGWRRVGEVSLEGKSMQRRIVDPDKLRRLAEGVTGRQFDEVMVEEKEGLPRSEGLIWGKPLPVEA